MQLLFTSDLHGLESAYVNFSETLRSEAYACGVIAGDLMTHLSPNDVEAVLSEHGLTEDDLLEELDSPDNDATNVSAADTILREALLARAGRLQSILLDAGKPVFFVMGNDDGIIDGGIEWRTNGFLQNVNQRSAALDNYRFVGYQYTSPFVGGRYEKPEDKQRDDLTRLSPFVDRNTILITHGPPRGILDGDSFGSAALRSFVDKHQPRLHLFGHIHQAAGIRWPYINGAFPRRRSFVSVQLEAKHAGWLDQIPI